VGEEDGGMSNNEHRMERGDARLVMTVGALIVSVVIGFVFGAKFGALAFGLFLFTCGFVSLMISWGSNDE